MLVFVLPRNGVVVSHLACPKIIRLSLDGFCERYFATKLSMYFVKSILLQDCPWIL
jgi:hypothetical protein